MRKRAVTIGAACLKRSKFMKILTFSGMCHALNGIRGSAPGLGTSSHFRTLEFTWPSSPLLERSGGLGSINAHGISNSTALRAAGTWSHADFRVAILFSECIGDLSRAGVRVQ